MTGGNKVENTLDRVSDSLRYVLDTRHRISLAVRELQGLLHYGEGNINSVLHLISEQEQVSRTAGFGELSRICEGMQDLLAEIYMQERPLSPSLVADLLSSCEKIRKHADSMAGETSLSEKPSRSSGSRPVTRVLLVDDDRDIQRLMLAYLSGSDIDVTLAENGQAGVRIALVAQANGEPFDVILMDMQMPVMDGCRATKFLRDVGYEGVIIAQTAATLEYDRRKCVDAGCDEYMAKPTSRQTLLDTLSKYLSLSTNAARAKKKS